MKPAYVFLFFAALNFANADEVVDTSPIHEGTYKIEGISNSQPCSGGEVSALCLAKPVKIPEDITMKIVADGKGGQNFEMASSCMTVKGKVKLNSNSDLKFKGVSAADHCRGQEISLYHEAAFGRLAEVHGMQKLADGTYRAAADGVSGLLMRPVN